MVFKAIRSRLDECLTTTEISQAELSRRTGYSESSISECKRNKHIMNVEVAKNIATVLGCGIEDLYEWKKKR